METGSGLGCNPRLWSFVHKRVATPFLVNCVFGSKQYPVDFRQCDYTELNQCSFCRLPLSLCQLSSFHQRVNCLPSLHQDNPRSTY